MKKLLATDKKTVEKEILLNILELVIIGALVLLMRLLSTFGLDQQWQIFNTIRGNKMLLVGVTLLLWGITLAMRWCQTLPEGRKKRFLTWVGFFFLLAGTALFVFWDYLLGNRMYVFVDIGADTYMQYFPQYLNMLQRLMEGSFTSWNWSYGLGTSMLNTMSQTLDPFGLLTMLGGYVLGIDKMGKCLVAALSLKMILSGFLCRYYLSLYGLKNRACMIGGYLYAFNAYMMLWGQHYFMSTICIYLILMLIFAEKMITGNHVHAFVGFSITVGLSLIYSVYSSYMALVFVAIFGIVRLLHPDLGLTVKGRILRFVKCVGSTVIGILMSAVVLLPMAEYLTHNSIRLQSSTSLADRTVGVLFSIYSPAQNFQILSRLMSNNLLYVNTLDIPGWENYYEMPNLSLTVFFYLILGQFIFLFFRNCKKKKICIYGLIVAGAVYLVLFNPMVSTAFNGFAYIATRHTFVLMPVFALMIAYVWQKVCEEGSFSLPGFICGGGVTAAIFIYSRIVGTDETLMHAVQLMVWLVLFAVILLLLWKSKKSRMLLLSLAMVCIVYTTASDAYFTASSRITLEQRGEGVVYQQSGLDNATAHAVEKLQAEDDSFFRIDKTYTQFSWYGDPLVYRYSSVTDYNSTLNGNLVNFYNNLYPEAIKESHLKDIALTDETMPVLGVLNVKYILSQDDYWASLDGLELVDQVEGIYIYRNTYADSIAHFYTKTVSESEAAEMEVSQRQSLIQDTMILEDDATALNGEKSSSDATIGSFRTEGNLVTGTVKTDTEGYLLLSIPYQNGWTVSVNEETVEKVKGDYGFTAIRLTAGDYEITAEYHIPYLKEGICCSIVGVILLILSGMVLRIRNKKEQAG